MYCLKCNKIIRAREHYFRVTEFDKNKIIGEKFGHKICQDDYDKMLMERQISPEMKQNLNSALKKANYLLTEMGGQEVIQI
jgi:hypothetical protein